MLTVAYSRLTATTRFEVWYAECPINSGNGRRLSINLLFQFTPDATVTLTDRQVKPASALKEGDKIVFWVPESRFGFYAKPGAAESQQFKVVSL